jgi:hypothetical protein
MASIGMFEVRYLQPEIATAQILLGKEELKKKTNNKNEA